MSDALDPVRKYLDGYTFRADEGDHTPTDDERALLEDFGNGLLAEIDTALAASPADVVGDGWNRNMDEAPCDERPILLKYRADLHEVEPKRNDMKGWNGLTFVGRGDYPGPFNERCWRFAAPIGYGGIPQRWLAAWRHLPPAPGETDEA